MTLDELIEFILRYMADQGLLKDLQEKYSTITNEDDEDDE